jgi:hypothetical protein
MRIDEMRWGRVFNVKMDRLLLKQLCFFMSYAFNIPFNILMTWSIHTIVIDAESNLYTQLNHRQLISHEDLYVILNTNEIMSTVKVVLPLTFELNSRIRTGLIIVVLSQPPLLRNNWSVKYQ